MPGPGITSNVFPVEEGADRLALSTAGKAVRIAAIVLAVVLLFFSVYLVAAGVRDIGIGSAERLFNVSSHPLIGVMVGLLATAVVQSSSSTTALTVAAVAAGAIGLPTAIPIILGANIGTTITPVIVAFSYAHNKDAFRRAFSTASLHMWFNTLMVLAVFPLEALFGLGRRAISALELPGTGFQFTLLSELAARLPVHGVWAIVAGALLLLVSIRVIDQQLRHLFTPLAWRMLGHTSGASAVAGFGAGMGLTLLIQASSATVSVTLPFATAKLGDRRGYLAIILGANVGTTFLALLTAYATPGSHETAALQAAVVHIAFNVLGAAVVGLISPMRHVIYRLAHLNGQLAARSVWLAFGVTVAFYFAFPAAVIMGYSLLA